MVFYVGYVVWLVMIAMTKDLAVESKLYLAMAMSIIFGLVCMRRGDA